MNFLLGWVIVILLPTLFNKDVINQTDNPMPTFQTNNENDYEANEVEKGIDWLQNWYATRKDMKSPDGRPFLTDAEYRNIEHTLKNLKVTLTNDIKTNLRKQIQNGIIKFKSSKAKYKAIMAADQVDRSVGLSVLSSTEPHVFINPKELLYSNLHWEESKMGTISGPLSKAVIHEATHAATYSRRHESVVDQIANADKRNKDPYFDMPSEIYACLNELRYAMGKEPTHIFTLEEVKEFRAKLEHNLEDYRKEVTSVGRKNFKNEQQLPLQDKAFDHHIFSRYTDEQILHLLNDVVINERPDLDEEHIENRRLDDSHFAELKAPDLKSQVQKESITQRLNRCSVNIKRQL